MTPKAPAKVCIDGFNLSLAKGSGIATYARSLLAAQKQAGFETQVVYQSPAGPSRRYPLFNEIALVDASPPGNWITRAGRAAEAYSLPFGRTASRVRSSGTLLLRQLEERFPPSDIAWSQRNLFDTTNRSFALYRRTVPLRFADGAAAPDLMHWTCPLALRAPGRPNVYTIHDLVPLRLPFATLDHKRTFFALCQAMLKRGDRIVTVSERSRADILQILGGPEDRVVNTYQAVSIPEKFLAKTEVQAASEIEGMFGLGWRSYFLFFGAIEPKKNLARAVQAYLASGVDAPFVIVGGRAWLDDAETRLIYDDIVQVQTVKDETIRRRDRIRRYDYLPFSLLVSLIRGARATLFPSLYEGFGLPVLESMLLGTPVLTSTEGSLPEVAGDAALFVDPYDANAIARGIRELDADEGLRNSLVERGRAQAAKYSMAAYAERISAVYRDLI